MRPLYYEEFSAFGWEVSKDLIPMNDIPKNWASALEQAVEGEVVAATYLCKHCKETHQVVLFDKEAFTLFCRSIVEKELREVVFGTIPMPTHPDLMPIEVLEHLADLAFLATEMGMTLIEFMRKMEELKNQRTQSRDSSKIQYKNHPPRNLSDN